jgi:hypothetical protein
MSKELSPVAAAVEPSRAAAVQRARDFAKTLAERTLEDFAKDPSIAEYPRSSGLSRGEFFMKKSVHDRIVMLTVVVPQPNFSIRVRKADQALVDAFINHAGESASTQYTAFIMKLEKKIGTCLTATLTGDHVWGYSLLTVTKDGGASEVWKTQQIINVSKLGRPFNQWPTRKLGGRAKKVA